MKLDGELYRRTYQALREWSAAAEQARASRQLSPAELWQQYVALVEFCLRLCPGPSAHQRREKTAALNLYYERLRKLEQWRQKRGGTA